MTDLHIVHAACGASTHHVRLATCAWDVLAITQASRPKLYLDYLNFHYPLLCMHATLHQTCRTPPLPPPITMLRVSAQTMQAQEQLLLRLRDHLEAHPALTASHQRLQHRLQGETCMGSRLALTPQVLEILKGIPSSTFIITLYVSQDASVLYCATCKGQQTSRTVSAGKSKPTRQGKTETLQLVLPCIPMYGSTPVGSIDVRRRLMHAQEQRLYVLSCSILSML